jgi:hypothetical protein
MTMMMMTCSFDSLLFAATVKDLRRQISDFKSEIIKLQDILKSREAELNEAQRKVTELTSLSNMQDKRLERLSDLEVKLQTIQMQSKSELSKKEAAFKRETDAFRLQLVCANRIELLCCMISVILFIRYAGSIQSAGEGSSDPDRSAQAIDRTGKGFQKRLYQAG